jgi:hypothetical protein
MAGKLAPRAGATKHRGDTRTIAKDVHQTPDAAIASGVRSGSSAGAGGEPGSGGADDRELIWIDLGVPGIRLDLWTCPPVSNSKRSSQHSRGRVHLPARPTSEAR